MAIEPETGNGRPANANCFLLVYVLRELCPGQARPEAVTTVSCRAARPVILIYILRHVAGVLLLLSIAVQEDSCIVP